MKQRFRTNCCSHATSDGRAYMGREEKLRKKLNSNNITNAEMRELAGIIAIHNKKPDTVIVSVFGKRTVVKIREYKEIYEPQGFKAL